MSIEPIIDFEIAEMVRFYGTLIGTTGVSKKVQEMCNINLEKLLETMQPSVNKLTAGKAGIITK